MVIQTIRSKEGLPRETAASIYTLIYATWPPKPGAEVPTLDDTLAKWERWQSTHFVITKNDTTGGEVLAHALIFRREVFTPRGPLPIGALAKVCVHRAYRGRERSADVVRAAFDYLPELSVPVSLFQTGVPLFYENLGRRPPAVCCSRGAHCDGAELGIALRHQEAHRAVQGQAVPGGG